MIVDWLPTPSQHLLVSAVALLIYVLTTRAADQRRAPTSAIAWVLGLALVPYVMLPLYLLFGQRKLPPVVRPYAGVVVEGPHWAAELIESFGLSPPAQARVRFHADGEEARSALFETIDRARARLDVSTLDRKSTRLNSSHLGISYAVFCLKKKKHNTRPAEQQT